MVILASEKDDTFKAANNNLKTVFHKITLWKLSSSTQ